MEDRILIYKIQRGQTELLNVIAEKYYDDIYRFCLFLTGQPEDSQDLAQETFLRFIRYVEHYKCRNLKGYLLTIARNLCMDYFKTRENPLPFEESTFKNAVSSDELSCLLWKQFLFSMLQKLPPMQREVLLLYYFDNLKIREIASVTGAGISTVKSRLKQGTEKLKKWIKEEEHEGSDFTE